MTRERSPNYPAIGLSAAVDALKAFYDKERRTSVPAEVAAKAFGYSGLSGPARVKIATLKKYGLLEGNDRTGLKVSELGMHILFPSGGEEEDESRRKAALEPELFRSLYDNFSEASDDALKSHLVTRLHFAPVGARQVIAAFRDTMTFANLKKADYNSSDISSRIEAPMQADRTPTNASAFGGLPLPKTTGPANVFTWPLSKGVTAEVRFTGGEVQPSHLDLLAKYLELAKSAIQTDDSKSESR